MGDQEEVAGGIRDQEEVVEEEEESTPEAEEVQGGEKGMVVRWLKDHQELKVPKKVLLE